MEFVTGEGEEFEFRQPGAELDKGIRGENPTVGVLVFAGVQATLGHFERELRRVGRAKFFWGERAFPSGHRVDLAVIYKMIKYRMRQRNSGATDIGVKHIGQR